MAKNNDNLEPINWPTGEITQLQQVKVAGISPKPNVAVPSSPSNVTPSTQGQPQNLSNIQVRKTSINGSQYQLTVSFDHNPGDPYYQQTNIYVQQGGNQPVNVGSGTTSPINVVVSKSQAPITVFAQASGNWGAVPIGSAPGATLTVADTSPIPMALVSPGAGSGGGISGTYPHNQVAASPAAGGSGSISVRSLVAADIPFLPASIITSGTLALGVGGTGANLSLTGGTSQFLAQLIPGGPVTVKQLSASDLSNGTTGTGAVVLASALLGTSQTAKLIEFFG